MPRTLEPIPDGVPIVDKSGSITTFFRLRWQALINGFTQSASVAALLVEGQTDALVATSAYLTTSAGRYRVSVYLRKIVPDGVSSAATVTISFVDTDGQALSITGPALALDAVGAWQSLIEFIRCEGGSDIEVAVAYASNTPHTMIYDLEVVVEYLP